MSGKEYAEPEKSIFEVLNFSPEKARELRDRSKKMIELQNWIKMLGLIEDEAAKCLGVTKEKVRALQEGHIEKFRDDELFYMYLCLERYVNKK